MFRYVNEVCLCMDISMLIYVHEVCLDVYIPAGGLGGFITGPLFQISFQIVQIYVH